MTNRIGPIQQDEIKSVVFDFSNEGVSGTLVSADVEAVLSTGTDPSPSTVVSGSATIDGLTVIQSVQYQVPNATYLLRCTATDSAGLVHVVTALMQSKAVA